MATCEDIANEIAALEAKLEAKQADFPNRTDKARAFAEIYNLVGQIRQKNQELTNCIKKTPGYETDVEILDLPGQVVQPGNGTIWNLPSLGQLSVENEAIQNNRIKFNYPGSIIGSSIGITIEDSPNPSFSGPMFRSGPYSSLPLERIQIIVVPATLLCSRKLKAKLPSAPLRLDSNTMLNSLDVSLDANGITLSVTVSRTVEFLFFTFSIDIGYTLRFSLVPSWNVNDTNEVCRVVASGPGTVTGTFAFVVPEQELRQGIIGALQSQLNSELIKIAASNFGRLTLAPGTVLSMRQVIHQGNSIVFFPALGAYGTIDMTPDPKENPKCAQIRTEIAQKQSAIEGLEREADGLNPKIKKDQDRIRQILAETKRLQQEITNLETQAASLGCK